MIRKYWIKELTDLELQAHPDNEKDMLLYIGTKEFVVSDWKFYMDFANAELLKEKKAEAIEQANGDKNEASKILLELMKDVEPVRYEYSILVWEKYRNMSDIIKSLE